MVMGNFILLVGALCLVAGLIVYLLHRFASKNVKYLIPLMALIATLYNVYMSQTVGKGFGDLVGIIYAMIFGSVTAFSFVVCLVLDYKWFPGRKKD